MKASKFITSRLARIALLAITGLITLAGSSQAVDFTAYVWTKYGWARVVPGSGTGGYVRSDAGGYYTDRVSRGETVCPVFRATVAGETSGTARAEYTCGNHGLGAVSIPGSTAFIVSQNAACDSLHVWVRSNCLLEKRRPVPIGSRPSNY